MGVHDMQKIDISDISLCLTFVLPHNTGLFQQVLGYLREGEKDRARSAERGERGGERERERGRKDLR